MTPIELLQELLRVDSTNPPGNEGPAAEILRARLDAAGLQTRIEKSPAGRPNLIARLPGPTDRPALVLLSHTDVVPVESDRWIHDPFGGEVHDGHIWGRGALDMKGIGALHCAAAEETALSGREPTRELVVCAVADEEAGGNEGAGWLVKEHPELVGFGDNRPLPEVLGEGSFGLSGVIERPLMPIVLGEKKAMWVELTATGDPGHGSLPPARQAPVNLAATVREVAGYGSPRVHPVMRRQFRVLADVSGGARKKIFQALASGSGSLVASALRKQLRGLGAIGALLADTVTPTALSAGYKHNVVPGEARASLDCRLLPDTDLDEFLAQLRKKAAKNHVSIATIGSHAGPVTKETSLFSAMQSVSEALPANPVVVPSLTPGFSDLRFFRAKGAAGYGWGPVIITPELLATVHGHDERIPVTEFETGVEAMTTLVKRAIVAG